MYTHRCTCTVHTVCGNLRTVCTHSCAPGCMLYCYLYIENNIPVYTLSLDVHVYMYVYVHTCGVHVCMYVCVHTCTCATVVHVCTCTHSCMYYTRCGTCSDTYLQAHHFGSPYFHSCILNAQAQSQIK